MTHRYVAHGPVRGGCGHRHLSATTAQECVERDRARCARLGGGAYSDRRVRVLIPGGVIGSLADAGAL